MDFLCWWWCFSPQRVLPGVEGHRDACGDLGRRRNFSPSTVHHVCPLSERTVYLSMYVSSRIDMAESIMHNHEESSCGSLAALCTAGLECMHSARRHPEAVAQSVSSGCCPDTVASRQSFKNENVTTRQDRCALHLASQSSPSSTTSDRELATTHPIHRSARSCLCMLDGSMTTNALEHHRTLATSGTSWLHC